MDKDTKRLLSEVRRELRNLRSEVKQRENAKLLETYRELMSTID